MQCTSSDVYLVLFCSSIVALVVYFVVGSLAMFYVKKARGIEVVPHLSFWMDFPFLLRVSWIFITYISSFFIDL